jgi:hypothetical protein
MSRSRGCHSPRNNRNTNISRESFPLNRLSALEYRAIRWLLCATPAQCALPANSAVSSSEQTPNAHVDYEVE